jgi:hypothetical protein
MPSGYSVGVTRGGLPLGSSANYGINEEVNNGRPGQLPAAGPKASALVLTEAIVQYVLELDLRSFPPRLYSVEDIANHLLHVRDAPPVGKL